MCLTASEVIAEVFEFIIKSDFLGLLSSLLKFRFKPIGTTLVAYTFSIIFLPIRYWPRSCHFEVQNCHSSHLPFVIRTLRETT